MHLFWFIEIGFQEYRLEDVNQVAENSQRRITSMWNIYDRAFVRK